MQDNEGINNEDNLQAMQEIKPFNEDNLQAIQEIKTVNVKINYRSLNCAKARAERTKKKNEKLLNYNEEKAYSEVYSNLKKEKRKNIKLLQLAQMSKEVDDIKQQLSKYEVKPTVQPMQTMNQQSFFN